MTTPSPGGSGAEAILDCLVIGAGPAGLAAALYLARFQRRFAVVDGGASRAAWIPSSHNIPFFEQGLPGPEILARQRAHVERYGTAIIAGTVTGLEKGKQFTAHFRKSDGADQTLLARRVLLATGSVDIDPDLPDVHDAVRRGLLRYCPICDGYEARGSRVAVISQDHHGLNEAIFIARTYASDVTLLAVGQPMNLDRDQREQARQHGIKLVEQPIEALRIVADRVEAVRAGSAEHRFDTLYAALGIHYGEGPLRGRRRRPRPGPDRGGARPCRDGGDPHP